MELKAAIIQEACCLRIMLYMHVMTFTNIYFFHPPHPHIPLLTTTTYSPPFTTTTTYPPIIPIPPTPPIITCLIYEYVPFSFAYEMLRLTTCILIFI